MPLTTHVRHSRLDLDGVDIFYREAGPKDAPFVLLPHGYPCSSYEFRSFMPRLADRWRLVAPDFPGAGYSATPQGFAYTFDGYADFLDRFAERLGMQRFAIYLHDFGSQIGLRLAIRRSECIAAIIVQNGALFIQTIEGRQLLADVSLGEGIQLAGGARRRRRRRHLPDGPRGRSRRPGHHRGGPPRRPQLAGLELSLRALRGERDIATIVLARPIDAALTGLFPAARTVLGVLALVLLATTLGAALWARSARLCLTAAPG